MHACATQGILAPSARKLSLPSAEMIFHVLEMADARMESAFATLDSLEHLAIPRLIVSPTVLEMANANGVCAGATSTGHLRTAPKPMERHQERMRVCQPPTAR